MFAELRARFLGRGGIGRGAPVGGRVVRVGGGVLDGAPVTGAVGEVGGGGGDGVGGGGGGLDRADHAALATGGADGDGDVVDRRGARGDGSAAGGRGGGARGDGDARGRDRAARGEAARGGGRGGRSWRPRARTRWERSASAPTRGRVDDGRVGVDRTGDARGRRDARRRAVATGEGDRRAFVRGTRRSRRRCRRVDGCLARTRPHRTGTVSTQGHPAGQ